MCKHAIVINNIESIMMIFSVHSCALSYSHHSLSFHQPLSLSLTHFISSFSLCSIFPLFFLWINWKCHSRCEKLICASLLRQRRNVATENKTNSLLPLIYLSKKNIYMMRIDVIVHLKSGILISEMLWRLLWSLQMSNPVKSGKIYSNKTQAATS